MRVLIAFLIAALLLESAFSATTQLAVGLPAGGTTQFYYDDDSTAKVPLVRVWDGTNKMTILAPGQASPNASTPVVLPAVQVSTDPCALQIKTIVPITFSTAAITQVVAPAASPPIQTYVCAIMLSSQLADVISIIGGTGATCGTSTNALLGSTTASAGMTVSAGVPFVYGNGSASPIVTKNSGDGICIQHTITTSNTVAGTMAIVRQ